MVKCLGIFSHLRVTSQKKGLLVVFLLIIMLSCYSGYYRWTYFRINLERVYSILLKCTIEILNLSRQFESLKYCNDTFQKCFFFFNFQDQKYFSINYPWMTKGISIEPKSFQIYFLELHGISYEFLKLKYKASTSWNVLYIIYTCLMQCEAKCTNSVHFKRWTLL